MNTRACIYLRTWSGEADQENSLKTQLQACNEWCERNGATAVMVFADAAMCAATRPKDLGPSIDQMLEMAAEPNPYFNMILAYSPSRLFRRSAALESCMAAMASGGVRVEFVINPGDRLKLGEVAISMLEPPTDERQ